MQFGICAPVEESAIAKAAGFDFIEPRVDQLIEGLLPDDQWKGLDRAAKSALPIPSANVLFPAALKITGPDANLDRLKSYMTTVLSRARKIGIKTLIFGSGAARKFPEGTTPAAARQQLLAFLKTIAPLLQQNGVTLTMKPLIPAETNIGNSTDEVASILREVNHPSVRMVLDTYHFWLNNEPLESLANAMPLLSHLNVADADRKRPKNGDYRSFFAVLKKGGYKGPIAVEAIGMDIAGEGGETLAFLKSEWAG